MSDPFAGRDVPFTRAAPAASDRRAGGGEPPRAVIVDALGTLVRLRRPAPRLRAQLATRGVQVTEAAAEAAFRAEVHHYLAHHLEGSSEEGLDRLRDGCARVVAAELGLDDVALVREALLRAISFSAYPDAAPALSALRAAGLAVIVASNWDRSLEQVLERVGLRSLLGGVVTSAEVGAAKPRPDVFRAALRLAGCEPGEAICVGDSVEHDVAGARAAGVRAVLLVRSGSPPTGLPPDVEVVRSLGEARSLVLSGG